MARQKPRHVQLAELLKVFEPEIRAAFIEAIQRINDEAILQELIDAVRDGDVNRIVASLGLDAAALRPLTAAIERAFETGGITTAATFPRDLRTPITRTVFRFDVRNSRAEAWLRDKSSQYVQKIVEDARTLVRNVLFRGVQRGAGPNTVALDIVGRIDPVTKRRTGGVIGLTPKQDSWVEGLRRDLENLDGRYFSRRLRPSKFDDIVQDAIDAGVPLDKATIDKLVTMYRNNMLRYRGETIGRTEAIAALNRAEQEAILQAVDSGMVKRSAVTRIWDSAGDDGKTRESHLEMDGQTVGLEEPFTFPDGTKAMFPGDTSLDAPAEETINCRCIARTKIDWLAGARDVMTDDERRALAALSDDELFGGRA